MLNGAHDDKNYHISDLYVTHREFRPIVEQLQITAERVYELSKENISIITILQGMKEDTGKIEKNLELLSTTLNSLSKDRDFFRGVKATILKLSTLAGSVIAVLWGAHSVGLIRIFEKWLLS